MKQIYQIDLVSNEIIKKWNSLTDASNKLDISISVIVTCARGKILHAGGFEWEYVDKEESSKYVDIKLKLKNKYRIKQTFDDGGVIIFNNMKEAAEYNNVSGDNFILKLFNLPGKVKIVKSTVVLLFTCGVWFLMELFLSIFLYDIHKYIDFLIASTLCLLSILLSYTFIKHPKKITVA